MVEPPSMFRAWGRDEFGVVLQRALVEGPNGQAWRGWVSQLAIEYDGCSDNPEQVLFQHLTDQLDFKSNEDEFRKVGTFVLQAMSNIPDLDDLALVASLVWPRDGLLDVISKHLRGTISKVSFQSFIKKRALPTQVERAILSMSEDHLGNFLEALALPDWLGLVAYVSGNQPDC